MATTSTRGAYGCYIVFRKTKKRIMNGSYLDSNNIVWKITKGEWIGKRSVWTLDWRACWLEDTTTDNVKLWWCGGKNANYTEVFKKTNLTSLELSLSNYLK